MELYYHFKRLNLGNIQDYFVEYCQSHIRLLWIWIMLWCYKLNFRVYDNHNFAHECFGKIILLFLFPYQRYIIPPPHPIITCTYPILDLKYSQTLEDEKRTSQTFDPTFKIGSNVRWAKKLWIKSFVKEGSNPPFHPTLKDFTGNSIVSK